MNAVNKSTQEDAPRQRGAPPTGERLSRDVVVQRASALLEEEGLASFSLRRLATDLDVRPAALYNHVQDRDELLDAVADEFIGQFDRVRSDIAWQQAVQEAARSARRRLRSHPHMTDLLLARRAAVPATQEYIQGFIAVLEDAGFDGETAHATVHAFLTAVLGTAVQERAWDVDRTGQFEFLIDLIVDGVAAEATRGSS